MSMDINKIIIFLIVAIVICVAILLYFVITDKKKLITKDNDKVAEPVKDTVTSSNKSNDVPLIKATPIEQPIDQILEKDPINTEVSKFDEDSIITDSKQESFDADGPTQILTSGEDFLEEKHEIPETVEKDSFDEEAELIGDNLTKTTEVPKEVTPKKMLNPLPIIKNKVEQTTDLPEVTKSTNPNTTGANEIGFLGGNDTKDAVAKLLQSIALELNRRANEKEKTCINYLDDNALDLKIQNGYFLLNNEEIMRNGILQDGDVVDVYAGDRVIIRFCVNFAVPSGYDIQVVSDINALKSKGLVVKDIICPNESSLSIRAILQVEEACKIAKTDNLFKVHIMQEVVQ